VYDFGVARPLARPNSDVCLVQSDPIIPSRARDGTGSSVDITLANAVVGASEFAILTGATGADMSIRGRD